MLGAQASERRFTFAVVGRNEAPSLAGVIAEAQKAAGPDDRFWFVDSDSTDDSFAIARGLGVDVIRAPAGKGRAMQAALDRCREGYICFLDADFFHWTVNVPATLRAAAIRSAADMVVGCYSDDRRRVIQPYVYWPLVNALFPDHGGSCDPTPLSGLRAINASLPLGPLPPGYGVETYLNLTVAAAGRRIETVDLGFMRGPLRGYANVPELIDAVASEILDLAVGRGRLAASLRPEWDRWVANLRDFIATQPLPGAPDGQFLAKLATVASQPFPPTRAAAGRAVQPAARRRHATFTFAVVGRNESCTLPGVIAEAKRAAGPDDRVMYADSASEDDSVSIALGLGIDEVIRAPRGKGRAMQAVLDRCTEGWVCFLDADLLAWERSIPETLRTAALSSGCQMVIGEYTSERRRMVTPSIYWPLVDRLFPEYGRRCDPRPLSGLRVIDASLRLGPLPPGYGAETYLNLAVATAGHRIAVANLGEIKEPLRGYSNVEEIATAVSDAILDFAIAHDRIASASRPQWEQWARGVIDLLAQSHSPGAPDAEFRAALGAAVARALPPTEALRSTPDPSTGLRARRAVR